MKFCLLHKAMTQCHLHRKLLGFSPLQWLCTHTFTKICSSFYRILKTSTSGWIAGLCFSSTNKVKYYLRAK